MLTYQPMETKICKVCGRELPETDFPMGRGGIRAGVCKECRTAALRETKALKRNQIGGGKTAPFSDPNLDGKEPREVIDTMVRCRKWLESRGFEITMTCIYKEVKIRKIKLE